MRLQVWTPFVALVATLVQLEPALRDQLIFDREAIHHGELWRLVTGNLVHFSWSHLAGDLAVLVITSSVIEARNRPHAGLLLGGSAIVVGSAVLMFEPQIRLYGGLSGLSYATVTFLALSELNASGWRRLAGAAALAAVMAKLGLDGGADRHVVAADSGASLSIVATAHVAGVGVAVCLWLALQLRDRKSRVNRYARTHTWIPLARRADHIRLPDARH